MTTQTTIFPPDAIPGILIGLMIALVGLMNLNIITKLIGWVMT